MMESWVHWFRMAAIDSVWEHGLLRLVDRWVVIGARGAGVRGARRRVVVMGWVHSWGTRCTPTLSGHLCELHCVIHCRIKADYPSTSCSKSKYIQLLKSPYFTIFQHTFTMLNIIWQFNSPLKIFCNLVPLEFLSWKINYQIFTTFHFQKSILWKLIVNFQKSDKHNKSQCTPSKSKHVSIPNHSRIIQSHFISLLFQSKYPNSWKWFLEECFSTSPWLLIQVTIYLSYLHLIKGYRNNLTFFSFNSLSLLALPSLFSAIQHHQKTTSHASSSILLLFFHSNLLMLFILSQRKWL